MRSYYHHRHGPLGKPSITLDDFRKVFSEVIEAAQKADFFQEAIGYHCSDQGQVDGKLGSSLSSVVFDRAYLRVEEPLWDGVYELSKEELLGLVEVLFDLVSEGVKEPGLYHSWNQCGWHYQQFSAAPAQAWYRDRLSRHLECLDGGYELTAEGLVLLKTPAHLDTLLRSPLPTTARDERAIRVSSAVESFRNAKSTWDQRLAQVQLLASVLEDIRKDASKHLSGDESALFNVFNNFGIRHLTDKQKIGYDRPIFLTYVFYTTLSAIHTCERLIARDAQAR